MLSKNLCSSMIGMKLILNQVMPKISEASHPRLSFGLFQGALEDLIKPNSKLTTSSYRSGKGSLNGHFEGVHACVCVRKYIRLWGCMQCGYVVRTQHATRRCKVVLNRCPHTFTTLHIAGPRSNRERRVGCHSRSVSRHKGGPIHLG